MIHHRKSSPQIVTGKQRPFSNMLHRNWIYQLFSLLYSNSNHAFFALGFENVLQGKDSVHMFSPLACFAGFCAQPIGPALVQKI